MTEDFLLTATVNLKIGNAVAALIIDERGRYLLQRRSNIPEIWYPDHWGLFGGAIEPGERPIEALRRELYEELELRLKTADEFLRLKFDLTRLGLGEVFRNYFVVSVTENERARFVLHEGDAVEAFAPDEIFGLRKVTPYDAFAIWLHFARGRLRVD